MIVYKPREVPVDMDVLKECWDKNKHGAGLMFSEDGKLRIAKGFMKWRSLRRYIKRRGLKAFTDMPVAFHFRIATHGSQVERNCHPFQINENLAMMHNGIIRKMEQHIKDEDISDSEAFADRYVKAAFSSIDITALKGGMPINDLFDEYIGGSKLLFMDNDGEVAIVNEKAGSWPSAGLGDGMWFSNMIWKPVPKSTVTSGKNTSSIISYAGDFRIVEAWEHGRKIVKKYSKKTGALLSTSISHEPPSPPACFASRLDRQVTFGGSDDHVSRYRPSSFQPNGEDDDWYCLACAVFFRRGDANRSYWANGLTERIVDCPECGDSNTCDAEALYSEGLDNNDETMWLCYMCGADFYTDEMSISTTDKKRCPVCYSVNIYESEEHDLVGRFGLDYFGAEVMERGQRV